MRLTLTALLILSTDFSDLSSLRVEIGRYEKSGFEVNNDAQNSIRHLGSCDDRSRVRTGAKS